MYKSLTNPLPTTGMKYKTAQDLILAQVNKEEASTGIIEPSRGYSRPIYISALKPQRGLKYLLKNLVSIFLV